MQSAPEIGRAIVGAAKMARRDHPRDEVPAPPPPPISVRSINHDEPVVVPAVAIHVGLEDWDSRARALGGTSHHLAAGFAAKLAERLGRRRVGDGAVTLQIPLSDRTEGDTRANTLSFVNVMVDPTGVTSDSVHAL